MHLLDSISFMKTGELRIMSISTAREPKWISMGEKEAKGKREVFPGEQAGIPYLSSLYVSNPVTS